MWLVLFKASDVNSGGSGYLFTDYRRCSGCTALEDLSRNWSEKIFESRVLCRCLAAFISVVSVVMKWWISVHVAAALTAFKNALVDPINNLQSWISTSDPCMNWTGVFCDISTTEQPGNVIYNHVTELRMFGLGLSGQLVPDLGNLTYLSTLDVMWNQLTSGIPSTFGNLADLKILALSGNKLSGSIPIELGKLSKMNRIQLDENQFSGPVPHTFGNLTSLAHLHLNNNSFTGSIPKELGQCPELVHILLDNNQLTGQMPPEIGNSTNLVILQLDNNQLGGEIPSNYTSQLHSLTKLSCRNCSLTGPVPDLSTLEHLYVLDLSLNNLSGRIPQFNTRNITTIDLSHNNLTGYIPSSLTTASALQILKLSNNNLNGSIPDYTADRVLANDDYLLLDFQNNSFEYVSLGMVTDAANQIQQIDLRLAGNKDICTFGSRYITQINALCQPVLGSTFQSYGNINDLPTGGPIVVTYRLKSPSFSVFTAALEISFTEYLATGLKLQPAQVSVQSFQWQPGPRLLMIILINPPAGSVFNFSEVNRIETLLSNWDASNSSLFGPYELLGFQYLGKREKRLSTAAIAGLSVSLVAVFLLALILLTLCFRNKVSKGKSLTAGAIRRAERASMRDSRQSLLKITGVCAFSFKELAQATENFSETKEVGRGGYGKVYRGVLESGQVVAIKRANLDAIQRNTEFYNEIELLSRCHHRNLVALVGYCNDEEEQMLIYEFMEGGTLHQHLHADAKDSLNFATRLKIALGAAKGILYLHNEADPPIFHRDIKSNNILLDIRKQAKVADFGLSRLAPDFQDDLGDDTQSHVSTVVKGTPGYLDPEYFLTRKLTDKSDVYSFGVVLLEIITGMQPITYGKNLVREVTASFINGQMWKVIDQKMGSYPSEVMDTFVALAMSCVDSDTNARPTMKGVTRILETLVVNILGKGSSEMSISLDIQKEDFPQLDKPETEKGNFSAPDFDFFADHYTQGRTSTSSPGSSMLCMPSYSRFYRLEPAAPLQR